MQPVLALTVLLGTTLASTLAPETPKFDLLARDSGKCRSRWRYCGKTLLDMGWSRGQIIERVRNKEEATWLTGNNVDNVLFSCGGDNVLWFNSSCNKPGECKNAGANRDDFCS